MQPHSELLRAAWGVALDAGEAILAVYRVGSEATYKEDRSPLTAADLASERVIAEGLRAIDASIPIVSEETAAEEFAVRKNWTRHWLVDPLDGTKEFLKRNGQFTVNIALVEEGRPVLGVVYAPALGYGYLAGSGQGAFRCEAGGERQRISTSTEIGSPLKVAVSADHAGEETQKLIARLGEAVGDVEAVAMGSSLKICMVAEGRADLYPRLGTTMEWDTAAAHCVVAEAGGSLTQVDGSALLYGKEDLRNPWFVVAGSKSAAELFERVR